MGTTWSWAGVGVLITGASSGIGEAIARHLAPLGPRLVLTARRTDRLESLAEALRGLGAAEAHVLTADLTQVEAMEHVAEQATALLGRVDVLVANAGFSVPGRFDRTDLERTRSMIRLNVEATVDLAHRLLPPMVRAKHGGILTLSSVAGFQAAPFQAGYAGTKAFLLGWSSSLHQEMLGTGVRITALCPGVTDTEFFDAAGYRDMTGFLKWRMPAAKVARAGVRAFERGRMEVVPGLANKALVFVQRFVPRSAAARVSRWLMAGRRL